MKGEYERRQRENEEKGSQPAQKLKLLRKRFLSVLALEIRPVRKGGEQNADKYDSHDGQVDPEYPVPVKVRGDGSTRDGTNDDTATSMFISPVRLYRGLRVYLRRERRHPLRDFGVYSLGALRADGKLLS